jgi:iron-sulfur cluster repair protein YtfE (RIC family)
MAINRISVRDMAGTGGTDAMLQKLLREFEADLHQNIHLENNVLFPRALELEASAAH